MNNLLSIILLFGIVSCGFNSDKEANEQVTAKQIEEVIGDEFESQDFDGDRVLNKKELELGRSPYLADLPALRVKFLQNYVIEAKFKNLATGKEESLKIDTKVGRDDPSFKYRVGDLFIRDESYRIASSVGKFHTHSWGVIEEHDLSWVKYPEVDPSFYAERVLQNKKFFDKAKYEAITVTISLENSVKLQNNRGFKAIKNLELNFYYYNEESESYEILKTEKVERSFSAGVNETFEVTIENVPLHLLSENYFKKGEFIISEVKDFEIPEIETTYKDLLKSIKHKSIPVVFNTPLDSSVSYVGVNGKKASFYKVLGHLFDKKVTIENDVLKKINQFENNLPDFTYLKEIAKLDKNGKWFVFTNKINQHYLDYNFGPKDTISLSYITGRELANQSGEKIVGIYQNISGGDDYKIYGIGNITPNSKIDIQISPVRKWGEAFSSENKDYRERPCSCGRNCICGILTVDCYVKVNHFSSYDHGLKFNNNLTGELERVSLIINDSEFALTDLVEKQAVSVSWKGNNIHLVIDDPTKILEIVNFEDNVMFFKLKNISGTTFQGAYMHNATGKDKNVCPEIVANASRKWGLAGVYSGSVMIDVFRRFVPQGLKLLPPRPYAQSFSVSVSSVVNNMFN